MTQHKLSEDDTIAVSSLEVPGTPAGTPIGMPTGTPAGMPTGTPAGTPPGMPGAAAPMMSRLCPSTAATTVSSPVSRSIRTRRRSSESW